MPLSVVHMQHSDGSAARLPRVVLGFSSGMIRDFYTLDHDNAIGAHSATGRAAVYLSGTEYHSFHAPRRTDVTV